MECIFKSFAIGRSFCEVFLQSDGSIQQLYDQFHVHTLFSFSTFGTLYVAMVAILGGFNPTSDPNLGAIGLQLDSLYGVLPND